MRSLRVSVDVPAGPKAGTLARKEIDPLREELDPETFDDIRLLVTELVTNSARHAGIPEGTPIHLEVRSDEPTVRTEVHDPGPGFSPVMEQEALDSGWGLRLLERLSHRWGIERDHGTTVWFEIDPQGIRRAR